MTVATRLPCDEAALRAAAPASPCDAARRRWVLVAAIVGSSLAFVDGTVVNIALPAIQQSLGASAAQVQWVVEAYALLLSALLLAGGALGDRFGRRRMFLAGTVVFALASLGCALAPTVHVLIGARAVQGLGAALLVPGSLALISAAYPEPERGPAFGTWAAFSGIASGLGPLVGGWLVDRYAWPWAFAINLPAAAVLVAITLLRVPDDRPAPSRTRFDAGGAVTATLALAGAVFAFTEAPVRGWTDVAVLGAAALALVAGAAFVAVERRHPAPMVPLGLLGQRTFAGANLLTLLLYAGLGGGLYFLPLNLVQVQGLSATQAGAALLPFILVMFLLSRWAGGLVERHGARPPLVLGPALAGAGFALLAVPGTGASYWGFLPGVVVLGIGMGVAVAPLTTVVMGAVPGEAAGVASGINNAVSRMAGVLALAVFGWLMAGVFGPQLRDGLEAARLPGELVQAVWAERGQLAGLQPPPDTPADAASAIRHATHEAFVAGFRAIMVASAVLAWASAAVAAMTMPPRGRKAR